MNKEELIKWLNKKYPLEFKQPYDGTHVISKKNLEFAKRRTYIIQGWELAQESLVKSNLKPVENIPNPTSDLKIKNTSVEEWELVQDGETITKGGRMRCYIKASQILAKMPWKRKQKKS